MRILQILPELNVGGVETGTIDFATYLIEHGHHAVVVSNGGRLVERLEKAGITHYQLPVHKKSLWIAWSCIKPLRKILIEENIDILHARSRVPAWIGYFACRNTQTRFITTCHGYYSLHTFSRIMGWAKRVIVPSEVIGRHMIDNFGVPAENIRCIPRSVDLERFEFGRKKSDKSVSCVITMIGRLTPLKGHLYFLQAMAKVLRQVPYIKVWIIGDAPKGKEVYRQELELQARRLGLADVVEFLGVRQDIPQLLQQTDVLVMSSTVPESFGRVILEAQAVGVPVVATKVGGVVEIIEHEKTGLLVLPKEPDEMADAVLRYLRDKKFTQQICLAARKKIEQRFTLAHMAEQTIAVYHELMASLTILVIKLSSLGDVILITASLKALRQKFPQAKIHCLVGKESRQILQHCPYLDGLLVIDHKHHDRRLWRLWQYSHKLRELQPDITIDFQNNTASHLLAYLSFTKTSYGYRRGKTGFLLSHPVTVPNKTLPPVAHQFQILAMLGIKYHQGLSLELWPSPQDYEKAQKLMDAQWLGGQHPCVGINLAASKRWESKNWPLEYIAKLCDILAQANIRTMITGTEKDKLAVQKLLQMTNSKPADFVGKTDVMTLAALIKRCRVFISPDSAPMHIASAMHIPCIALFGPTSSKRHLPPGESFSIFERALPCAPCYQPQCRIRTHACMRDISPDEVAQRVKHIVWGKHENPISHHAS
jgi:lipopolysaccharide heptosyltransferase II